MLHGRTDNLTSLSPNLQLELYEDEGVGPLKKTGIERELKTLGVRVQKTHQNMKCKGHEVQAAQEVWDEAWKLRLEYETEVVYVHPWVVRGSFEEEARREEHGLAGA